MHMMYFTEQPMAAYDAEAGLEFGATALNSSNKYYNPVEGSRLYNEYLEEYIMDGVKQNSERVLQQFRHIEDLDAAGNRVLEVDESQGRIVLHPRP